VCETAVSSGEGSQRGSEGRVRQQGEHNDRAGTPREWRRRTATPVAAAMRMGEEGGGGGHCMRTTDSDTVSSSLSTAPGAGLLAARFLRFARLSSLFAFRISTCCSSRRRLNSSGLKDCLAL